MHGKYAKGAKAHAVNDMFSFVWMNKYNSKGKALHETNFMPKITYKVSYPTPKYLVYVMKIRKLQICIWIHLIDSNNNTKPTFSPTVALGDYRHQC